MQTWIRDYGRIATWLAVLILAVLSLIPGELRPHTFMPGRLEHFTAYGLTGCAIAIGYPRHRIRWIWWVALTIAALAFEYLQSLIPDRSPSLYDALASSAGLAVGVIFVGLAVDRSFRTFQTTGRASPSRTDGRA